MVLFLILFLFVILFPHGGRALRRNKNKIKNKNKMGTPASEPREPRATRATRARAAARAFRKFVVGRVAEFECAEMALHEVADCERLTAVAADIVQHGGEQHDAEAQAGIDEKQFVKFEAKHAAIFAPLARGCRRPKRT